MRKRVEPVGIPSVHGGEDVNYSAVCLASMTGCVLGGRVQLNVFKSEVLFANLE